MGRASGTYIDFPARQMGRCCRIADESMREQTTGETSGVRRYRYAEAPQFVTSVSLGAQLSGQACVVIWTAKIRWRSIHGFLFGSNIRRHLIIKVPLRITGDEQQRCLIHHPESCDKNSVYGLRTHTEPSACTTTTKVTLRRQRCRGLWTALSKPGTIENSANRDFQRQRC